MLVDAMVTADPFLHFSQGVVDNDMSLYANLTDDILRDIERSRQPELEPARALVKRLRKRQLYKFVEQFAMPSSMVRYLSQDDLTPATIIQYHQKLGGTDPLTEHDIIVDWSKINYGMANQNPVDHIQFYGKFSQVETFSIPRHQVSYLVPDHFEEYMIRVFARDPEKVPVIQKAVRACLESLTKNWGTGVSPSRSVDMDEDGRSGMSEDQCPRFEANQGVNVPSLKVWKHLTIQRGWSPNKVNTSGPSSSRSLTGVKRLLLQEFDQSP
jgi:hypothetical protein